MSQSFRAEYIKMIALPSSNAYRVWLEFDKANEAAAMEVLKSMMGSGHWVEVSAVDETGEGQ